ncbi:MAG: 50S ribosomal protein L18 [Firmicutes bacterium]|nr:50S ribosomal protein L18 [Bacillota bacterium]
MIKKSAKNILRNKKHYRMRRHIIGTEVRPRLSVFRSEKHMYAQIIDDSKSMTLVSASTLDADVKAQIEKTNDTQAAAAVGKVLAERAAGKGITEVVFDRGGFLYHGRVQALADAAREAGLKF